MDQASSGSRLAGAEAANGREMSAGALRCTICRKRLGSAIFYLEETGDVPEPLQSWMLCGDCNEAVKLQLSRTQIRTPLRLRVAVGLVAAERTPEARRARMGQLSDTAWLRLLFWAFILAMLVHLALIVFVAGITH